MGARVEKGLSPQKDGSRFKDEQLVCWNWHVGCTLLTLRFLELGETSAMLMFARFHSYGGEIITFKPGYHVGTKDQEDSLPAAIVTLFGDKKSGTCDNHHGCSSRWCVYGKRMFHRQTTRAQGVQCTVTLHRMWMHVNRRYSRL